MANRQAAVSRPVSVPRFYRYDRHGELVEVEPARERQTIELPAQSAFAFAAPPIPRSRP